MDSLLTDPADTLDPAAVPPLAALPVAVIGAGPVGLAAAAHLVGRSIRPVVFERGPSVGHAMAAWSHVSVFSPWSLNIDRAARALLEGAGWTAPDPAALPTGGEIVRDYLAPLSRHPAIAPALRLGARVDAVTRLGHDKMADAGRGAAPFVLRWTDAEGVARRTLARAVIDASGIWFAPNPLGVDGLAVPGEEAAVAAGLIVHGIPDVLGRDRADHAGRRVLVVGGGHSAINVVLDLAELRDQAPGTEILWAIRRDGLGRVVGGGLDDRLPARGSLGLAARKAVDEGRVSLLAPYAAEAVRAEGRGLRIAGRLAGQAHALAVDRVVVATGFRPDRALLAELRVSLDPSVEAPPALAPLIDPNLHSCGSVPPHGAAELAHPEPGLYIVGAKSYGRAPTFLMATGYEQVRSVVAAIAGDDEAARSVHLVLPETGVCSGPGRRVAAPGRVVAVAAPGRVVADTVLGSAPASAGGGCCAPARKTTAPVPAK